MNLNLMCPINHFGYGVVSFNILNTLMEKDINVSLFPFGIDANGMQTKTLRNVEKALSNAKLFDWNAPTLRVWHQYQMAESVGSGKRTGLTFFEVELSQQEAHHLDSLDHLFVPSRWAYQMVNEKCVNSCTVHHMGVDRKIFADSIPTDKPNFIFLNAGKWEKRKGHEELIEAFKIVKRECKNVELWMVPNNPFLNEKERGYWHSLYKVDGVKLFGPFATQQELSHLMGMSDCGVFPAKAEAWNMEALEMLSKGRQIIITNCSAHTEYCNNENSTLLNELTDEIAQDGKWFHGRGTWKTPSIKELADAMISEYRRGRHYNNQGVLTAKSLTWEDTVDSMLEYL